jgi:hypothetical protein
MSRRIPLSWTVVLCLRDGKSASAASTDARGEFLFQGRSPLQRVFRCFGLVDFIGYL